MQKTERLSLDREGMRPHWQAPRLVVQGHVTEIVATGGNGKQCYGPDKDSLKGQGAC